VRSLVAYVTDHRTAETAFDVVVSGATPGDDPAAGAATVAPLADAGATWWIEGIDPWRFGLGWEDQWSSESSALMQERVRRGPPKG
jgi:hypothetical protein